MLNFYSLRQQLKQAVVNRLEALTVSEHPFDWAWLAYALATEGVTNNPLFDTTLEQQARWASSPNAWEYDRNLSSIAMCCYLLHKVGKVVDETRSRLIERLKLLKEKAAGDKFCPPFNTRKM